MCSVFIEKKRLNAVGLTLFTSLERSGFFLYMSFVILSSFEAKGL